jgi:hypothetical protein
MARLLERFFEFAPLQAHGLGFVRLHQGTVELTQLQEDGANRVVRNRVVACLLDCKFQLPDCIIFAIVFAKVLCVEAAHHRVVGSK